MPQPTPDDLKYFLAVEDAASKAGVDPDVIHRMVQTESGGNPSAVSPKGAVGLMQLMPATAKGLGVDPRDPMQNIQGGVKYFKQNLDHYGGDIGKAAAAYNAGPGRVDSGQPLPAETRRYVQLVQGPPQEAQAPAAPPTADDLKTFLAQELGTQTTPSSSAAMQAPAPEGPSTTGFLMNVANSAGQFGMNMANALLDIKGTAKGLGKLGVGVAEKAADVVGVNPQNDPLEKWLGDQRGSANAVGHYYGNRYGGIDQLLHTLYTDPVGAAADVSTVAGIGEGLLPGKLGEMAGRVAEVMNPLSIPTKAAATAATHIAGAALPITRKFVDNYGLNKADLGETLLENKAFANANGVKKLLGERANLAADKGLIEAGLPAADPRNLVQGARGLIGNRGIGVQANPVADVAAVNDVVDEFLNQHKQVMPLPNGQNATVWNKIAAPDVEAIKSGTYTAIKNAYTDLNERPAKVQAQAAIARDMRRYLEDASAGQTVNGRTLAQMNEQDKILAATQHAVERKLGTPSKGIGLGETVEGGLAALGHPLAAAGMWAARSPFVEQALAHLLYRAPVVGKVLTPTEVLKNALTP